jgi:hypothetical protein
MVIVPGAELPTVSNWDSSILSIFACLMKGAETGKSMSDSFASMFEIVDAFELSSRSTTVANGKV